MNARILSNPKKTPSAAEPASELRLGGITPFTTIDFPGRLAAVFYTQGCAWRCRYCHNAHLQPFSSAAEIPFEHALAFLEGRRGLLDGVVFCGGEPTLQRALPSAMQAVRRMGFQVALHTAGPHPEYLGPVLPLCDWVGMDIKAPFALYEKITGIPRSGEAAKISARLLLKSGTPHEFRTTLHPALLSESEILELAVELSALGAEKFILQLFQPRGCGDMELKPISDPNSFISDELKNKLSVLFGDLQIRL